MSRVRFQIAVSLDGFIAGPDPNVEDPLGIGGENLHEWMFGLKAWLSSHGEEGGEVNVSNQVIEEAFSDVGAYIMGRNMFGGGPGPWRSDTEWRGWWGDNPPYHTPVFVLTHHSRQPLQMQGGTTFIFVTDGIDSALQRAKDAAGNRDVVIAGGANVAQQYLAAGAVDEFELHIAPLLLGGGTRLLQSVGELKLEQVRALEAPGVTHIKYRVVK